MQSELPLKQTKLEVLDAADSYVTTTVQNGLESKPSVANNT